MGKPPAGADVTRLLKEQFYDDGSFPPLKGVKQALATAKNPHEERPAPFQGKTLPFAALTVVTYGQRLASWFDALEREAEALTTEHLAVLDRVA